MRRCRHETSGSLMVSFTQPRWLGQLEAAGWVRYDGNVQGRDVMLGTSVDWTDWQ